MQLPACAAHAEQTEVSVPDRLLLVWHGARSIILHNQTNRLGLKRIFSSISSACPCRITLMIAARVIRGSAPSPVPDLTRCPGDLGAYQAIWPLITPARMYSVAVEGP
jgi:hypothetical protein